MSNSKQLSNPFSTGSGGAKFEAHVQASFVALMLSGGYAPCLPCWPIVEIKLQGRIDGYDTDDLIVFAESPDTKERRKLLGQVKHSIAITQSSKTFKEVMQAAWNDFNNPEVFTRDKDAIALITGPLSATDEHNIQWLLTQARYTKNVDEFLRNVNQANFSPSKSYEKLQVIRYHLEIANTNNEVSDDELYEFLKHFHFLDYDLGNESGVVLSLLHSHFSQFQNQYPKWVWSRIVEIVQTFNQSAGTITRDKLPEDLLKAFEQKVLIKIPEEFKTPQDKAKTDWAHHPDATYLALAILIGSWNEKSNYDLKVITQLLGIDYDDWLQKAREILHCPDSPLSLRNGAWKIQNRAELWSMLGSRILDQNLDTFKSLALTVLKQPDPAFELSGDNRYAAPIYGKILDHSHELRRGIAEGLAILGSQPEVCNNCSLRKAEMTCVLAIREILSNADWVMWGSINNLLPTLAEAAPNEFLAAIEKTLQQNPSPFDQLFAEEGNGITGRNYLTGLLWALEGLAWDEHYLVRVCIVLGELVSLDPGGKWGNRPANSLVTILLPWRPQTLAPFDKRKVVMETLFNECPEIAWKLIIQLLPDQLQTSSPTYRPEWRKTIPDGWKQDVTKKGYWIEVSFYAERAVHAAAYDTKRLSELIDHFNSLPKSAFDQLIEVLESPQIAELSDGQQFQIWDHLTKFTNIHRRYAKAKWALSDELVTRIESVSVKLAPTDPFYLYQHLFDYLDSDGHHNDERIINNARRRKAISEILKHNDIKGLIKFAEVVVEPFLVGQTLGIIADKVIEQALLPACLGTQNDKHKAMIRGFIRSRCQIAGWNWCDDINKSSWTPWQIGFFLSCLPFTKEVWDRASRWLEENEKEYWCQAYANPYETDDDFTVAIDKLIEYGRPHSAIKCLYGIHHDNKQISFNQCIRALLASISSNEPTYTRENYYIVELIKYLQEKDSVAQEDLQKVEWGYLPLLTSHWDASPKHLETRLSSDPEFFCEVIQLIYRSDKEDQPTKELSEESRAKATNAYLLLMEWKRPPGTQDDGTFSAEHFNHWLQIVKTLCAESGHLKIALETIGDVLIHAPPDSDGLWIHRSVALAMNDRDAENMRKGFWIGINNARGVHCVDPTGKPEKELAKDYRQKAEDVENAGFHRFAITLRRLADGYEREAESIIIEDQWEEME